jgi:asparagine synthase (glutamine-hydrolysing)
VDEALYNQFQENAVRRVLSGYLGDLTVTNSNINPFPILIRSGRFAALRKLARKYNIQDNQPLTAFLKHAVLREFMPKWFQGAWDKFKKREDLSRKIDELPLRLNKGERETLQKKVNGTFWFPSRSTQDIVHHVWPNDIYLFDDEVDCAASHHQLEVTYPLCDRRLIELLMQIPVEHFYAGGRKRGLIRKAMAGILPEKVRLRRTKGSYSPQYTKLLQKEVNQIIEIINTEPQDSAVAKVIDLTKLKTLLKNLSGSKIEDSFTYFDWTLIEIFIWFYLSKTLENKKKKA